jgi:IS605 OrfB family transposase
MKINKAYKFRLEPTPTQEVILNKTVGSCRFVYNHFLQLNIESYVKDEKFIFNTAMINMLPELKEQFPFLEEVFSQSLQTVLRNLSDGFNRFFKGLAEFPKFKNKGKHDSFTCPQKFRILQDINRIMIPKVGKVKYRNSREIEGIVKSITVSKNWFKQKMKVSRLQEYIANCRYNFLHKQSYDIVKNHDLIGVEDLCIKGMVKNRKLAKSIHDVGWGKFNEMLKYKAFFKSKTLQEVGRFYPSSQLCSDPDCDGKKLMPLRLRTYVCEKCNVVIDRDFNASKNIEVEAKRLSALIII